MNDLLKLWVLEFNINPLVTDKNTKGCAVVKAGNSNEAISLLKAGGYYNGTPKAYNVTRVEEIVESPDKMLICEQIL